MLSACAGPRADVYFVKPYYCEPFGNSEERLAEYEKLMVDDSVPRTRAWIREADQACRANNVLLGEEEQGLP